MIFNRTFDDFFKRPVTWRPVLHFDFSLAGNATDHKVGQEVWSVSRRVGLIDMGYPPLESVGWFG